jgi:hypothetical protein
VELVAEPDLEPLQPLGELLVEQVGAVKPVVNDEEEALSLFTKPE